ncbi:7-cyano-7-deazaguanine synthase QueC [Selenihalanaerobacter shriftii]|uniref:7-cyano-7-deazaguanine synthase n=1 Tax=Selenihalanaerobacter shriftii TaxID=142842 RepID=A0A1T4K6F2_9FIRM|nr:7-cyano-7-deazaguanine synthase QueC [Selenihalanaerobacter shriftii]SJZ37996.1 preQ(0) biosynthesis protein QueC [Selenihalanaerobacter shriftii]
MNKKAIVLSSGGLDSTTCLSIALDEGYEVYPLSFLYGQKHSREIEQSKLIREELGIPKENHLFVRVDNIGESALTNDEVDIPEDETEGIPDTYVPARNMLFLSYAVSLAEGVGAEAVYIGISSIDYSGYPDCRPEFIEAYQKTIDVGTKAGVEGDSVQIKTPLIDKTKVETIEIGLELKAPYNLTTTCYRGEEKACGKCPSCKIRLKAFDKIGVKDPIEYETE